MTRNWATDPRNPKSPTYNQARHEADKVRQTSRDRSGYQRPAKPFGTVDGEGGNIPDASALFGDKHEYLMLRADEFVLNTGSPLGYRECFDFLASLPKNRIWTGFYFDYDVTMMCRNLPAERARRLFDPIERKSQTLTRSGAEMAYWGVEIDNKWIVEYVPHKSFTVGFAGQGQSTSHKARHTTISDTSGFFQGSFVKTITKWDIGTEEQREQIKRGKEARADFHEMDAEIDAYNRLECDLHNALMSKVRDVCTDVGYVPRQWQGAGSLASAILAKHGVPKRADIPALQNERFRALANAAYYGGRAETTASGPLPGPIYQYDINGAYVAALTRLPCLIHGTWKFTRERPKEKGRIWVADLDFAHANGLYLNNLPVRRNNGTIFFPQFGAGYYWSWEAEAAESNGTGIRWNSGWVYVKHCDCTPFAWIPDIYSQRLRLGKSDQGNILKLGTNSIYGKIAQSIGDAPYANPVWAGLITAWCRAMIIRAYGVHKSNIYMIMTDGIFSRVPLPLLPISNKLGQWDLKYHESMFIVQPGLYFLPDDFKTRGVPHSEIVKLAPVFREEFSRMLRDREMPRPVSVPVNNFITMRQALARNKWHTAGTWEKSTKEIGFGWQSKRNTDVIIEHRAGLPDVVRTTPLISNMDVKSIPYGKIIGGGRMESRFERYTDPSLQHMENDMEQPDWTLPLIAAGDE